MNTSQTMVRLLWHAGLASLPPSSTFSICESTSSPSASPETIESAVSDVIDALTRLNYEINGSPPSETPAKNGNLDRRLVYAMSEILRLLKPDADTPDNIRHCLERSEWAISTAWLAVISGDIDDIKEHLSEEEKARKK